MAPSNVFFWWLIRFEVRIVCDMANMIILLNKNEIEENNKKMAKIEVLPSQLQMPQSKECFNTIFLSSRLPQTPSSQILFSAWVHPPFFFPPSLFTITVFRQLFCLWHLWDSNSNLFLKNPPLYQFRHWA